MTLPGEDDCDDCVPDYSSLGRRSASPPFALAISTLPFLITFLIVAIVVFQRLYPFLTGEYTLKPGQNPASILSPTFRRPSSSQHSGTKGTVKRLSAHTFAATLALSAVLAELVLCEISDAVNPVVRGFALRMTIAALLVLLVLVIPTLETQSVIHAAGWRFTGRESGHLKIAWWLQGLGTLSWLGFFWASSKMLGGGSATRDVRQRGGEDADAHLMGVGDLVNATTEHVGVIGISLMAMLSGFAAVSAPWQSFGVRKRVISEASVSRKQAGLDATNDMLATKRSRLRALERKMETATPEGFLKKASGMFRGNADMLEKKSLEVEVAGLETMALSLSMSHLMLQARLSEQRRSKTPSGKALIAVSYVFSLYCIYRILTISLTAIRRRIASPDEVFIGSDVVNNILALLVRHYDSHLNREAWTRQISFFMSGVMLAASFSSVLQTFHLFARYLPSVVKAAQANLPLIVAQVSATYVISVALLLRGMIPGQVISDGLKGLGSSNMRWVDGWFETWFLGGAALTALGINLGRRFAWPSDWDEDEDIELGKIS